MVWLGLSLGRRCSGDMDDDDAEVDPFLDGLIQAAFRHAWLYRLDCAADQMFAQHPDLDLDRDCVVLTFEDIQELKWLDCEIALEHLAGRHRLGCPIGCLYREGK